MQESSISQKQNCRRLVLCRLLDTGRYRQQWATHMLSKYRRPVIVRQGTHVHSSQLGPQSIHPNALGPLGNTPVASLTTSPIMLGVRNNVLPIGLLLGCLAKLGSRQWWEPFPLFLSPIPGALVRAPGIGYELADSYG